MKEKEFLSQPFKLDRDIRYKRKLLESMKEHTPCSSMVISDMPRAPHNPKSSVERAALRVVELEDEIEEETERLEELKDEVTSVIRGIGNTELETLLEMRYILFMEWDEISRSFGYASNNIFRRHREALRRIKVPSAYRSA